MRKFVGSFLAMALFLLPALAQAAQVTLVWDAPDAAVPSGYKVYKGTSSGVYTESVPVVTPDPETGQEKTHCTVSGLTPDIEYYFAATALYPDGSESGYSNEVSKIIPIIESVVEEGDTPQDWLKILGNGVVSSVYDSEIASSVLIFTSTGATALSIRRYNLVSDPLILDQDNFSVRLKYIQPTNSYIVLNVNTTFGLRTMCYKPLDTSSFTSSVLNFGLGSNLKNGAWHEITRNIQADLQMAQPENFVIGINFIQIYTYGLGNSLIIDWIKFFAD